MAERIPQHTHCTMCGKAVPVSETLCSDECKQKYEDMIKKRKRNIYFIYLLMFIFFLFLVYQLVAGYS